MKKAAFMLDGRGLTVSALVERGSIPTGFKVNSVATLASGLILRPYGFIPAGWQFLVTDHDHENGIVALRAVTRHPVLELWDQTLILQPFCTEEALTAFNFRQETTRELVDLVAA